jgi:hypothetical protein
MYIIQADDGLKKALEVLENPKRTLRREEMSVVSI